MQLAYQPRITYWPLIIRLAFDYKCSASGLCRCSLLVSSTCAYKVQGKLGITSSLRPGNFVCCTRYLMSVVNEHYKNKGNNFIGTGEKFVNQIFCYIRWVRWEEVSDWSITLFLPLRNSVYGHDRGIYRYFLHGWACVKWMWMVNLLAYTRTWITIARSLTMECAQLNNGARAGLHLFYINKFLNFHALGFWLGVSHLI